MALDLMPGFQFLEIRTARGYTISQNTSPFASVRGRNGTASGRLDRVLCKIIRL